MSYNYFLRRMYDSWKMQKYVHITILREIVINYKFLKKILKLVQIENAFDKLALLNTSCCEHILKFFYMNIVQTHPTF